VRTEAPKVVRVPDGFQASLLNLHGSHSNRDQLPIKVINCSLPTQAATDLERKAGSCVTSP
jgi:hypothetical protein